MNIRFFTALVLIIFAMMPSYAQDISPGSRILIQADGRSDYSPRIVICGAASGLCLRDARSEPANKPMMITEEGLQVDFPAWGVIYLFRESGAGMVFDMDRNPLGPFRWSQ